MKKNLHNFLFNMIVLTLFVFTIFSCSALSYSETLDLSKYLEEYLKKNYPWAEIEVYDISEKSIITEVPERIVIKKAPPGKTIFLLEFKNNKKLTVTAEVRVLDWAVLTSRPLRKGDTLREGDLYLTLLDLEKIPKGSLRDIEEAVGKKLNRSLSANMPITNSALNEQRMVKRGQIVSMVIESPYFVIKAIGEVKENAYIGKKVRVINTSSKKIIAGVLVDENTVKVAF